MLNPIYIGVILIGLMHGLEPGHGWPVAVMYSMQKRNPVLSGAISSSIIGMGHLISSIAVVLAYVLLRRWFDFEAPWLKYVAAGVLLVLAFRLFTEKADEMEKQHGHIHETQPEVEHEHEHEHPGEGKHTHVHKHTTGLVLSLWGLASFAFILGFAHEEEFALLALVAGGANAWILMISYGLAVLAGLIAVTVCGVKIYRMLKPKLAQYEKYVPKASAVVLVMLVIVIIVF